MEQTNTDGTPQVTDAIVQKRLTKKQTINPRDILDGQTEEICHFVACAAAGSCPKNDKDSKIQNTD